MWGSNPSLFGEKLHILHFELPADGLAGCAGVGSVREWAVCPSWDVRVLLSDEGVFSGSCSMCSRGFGVCVRARSCVPDSLP